MDQFVNALNSWNLSKEDRSIFHNIIDPENIVVLVSTFLRLLELNGFKEPSPPISLLVTKLEYASTLHEKIIWKLSHT
jgi:hypothetical protein